MNTRTCSDPGFKALMVTQFLGALNDNVFKVVLTLLVVNTLLREGGDVLPLILINIVFILPFLLFSSISGNLTDRLSKSTLLRYTKIFEMAAMALGFFFFADRNVYALLAVLFLLGIHSTFFSPAKYGILPEILDEASLSKGNGYLQFWTFIAIILGSALGAALSIEEEGSVLPGLVTLLIAFTGYVASNFVTRVAPVDPGRPLSTNPLRIMSTLGEIKNKRDLHLVALGIAYFWAFAALYQMNLVLFAKELGGWSDPQLSMLLISLSVGVSVGSLLAGTVSEGKVELGLVPLGAAGIAVLSEVLAFSADSFTTSFFAVALLGASAGFYIVPLNAYFQEHSPAEKRGHCIAALNVLSFGGMLLFSLLLLFFIDMLRLKADQIFFIMGIASICVTVYLCWTLPGAMIRCLNWVLIHTVYRLHVVGREHVPRQGGALLVCNHISYVDACMVLASIERPVRFMMHKPIYEAKLIKPFAKAMGAIPVHGGTSKEDVQHALKAASEAVQNGEIVCIFAEGSISRVGNLLKFKRGLERIMEGVSAPIVPMHIDQVWGSLFSYKGGRFLWKLPKSFPYPVTVSYGSPMPSTAKSYEVRQSVQELSAEAFRYRSDGFKVLHRGFISTCKRSPFTPFLADSMGGRLRRQSALTAVLLLADRLRERGQEDDAVGVYLPSSVASVLVNVALLLCGRVPVNLNYTSGAEAMASAMRQCAIKTVITNRTFLEKAPLKVADEISILYLEDLQKEFSFGEKLSYWLAALFLPAGILERLIGARTKSADDVATVVFSSGSTGEPKGVVLTHGNISANVCAIHDLFTGQPDECVIGVLPFFHSFGFTATLWLPLLAGFRAVYHFNPLDAGKIAKLVQEHRATLLLATPTFLQGYVRKAAPEQFASLKTVMVGAEKLRDGLRTSFQEKFGITLLEGYGATELSPLAIANSLNFVDRRNPQVANKPGTVGHPIPGVAVRIVDPDTFAVLEPNTDGLLLVKGPNVMKGYLNWPEKTAEVIRDGWYVTGDIAKMDEDGFVTITDRLSRFSKIAGEMVPHVTVEDKIHEVLDEQEPICVVTAVPDERKGERLVVLSIKSLDGASVGKQLAERGLPNLWIPRPELFFAIPELPVLGSGKLDLKRIKTLAQELVSAAASTNVAGPSAGPEKDALLQ